jgi:hypothetical protein
MPLSRGDKIGPFGVLAPIGAVGMGEVWKARETTLKRDVAFKVLPATFLRDPDRMARSDGRWGFNNLGSTMRSIFRRTGGS